MKKEDYVLIGCFIALIILVIFYAIINLKPDTPILLFTGQLIFWITFKLTKK